MPQTLWDEDVQLEVEALQATFDNLSVNDSQHAISMRVTPIGSIVASPQQHEEKSCFVDVVLQLAVRQSYPLAAPEILLRDSHGLGSARLADLQQHLQQEADALLGEMMIGHLFECAREFILANNWPEGPCVFCLEHMVPCAANSSGSSSSASSTSPHTHQEAAARDCMCLPCYHAFHRRCFADWWSWQQQTLRQQQQGLLQHTGATAAAALLQEHLPATDEEGFFQLVCPICRAAFVKHRDLPTDLQQLLRQRLQQQQQNSSSGCSSSADNAGGSSGAKLTAEQQAPFREIQQRHAAWFAAQETRQGIITEVSYRLQDLEMSTTAATVSVECPVAGRQAAGVRARAEHTRTAGPGQAASSNVGRQAISSRWHPQSVMQLPGAAMAAGRGQYGAESSCRNSKSMDQAPARNARKLPHPVHQVPLVFDQQTHKARRLPTKLEREPPGHDAAQHSSQQHLEPHQQALQPQTCGGRDTRGRNSSSSRNRQRAGPSRGQGAANIQPNN